MSVVVVSLDRYDRIRTTIRALRMQTEKNRPEILVVAPSRDILNLEEDQTDSINWSCNRASFLTGARACGRVLFPVILGSIWNNLPSTYAVE